MSFPRYPKYKDSGVEWLGDVPKHWELTKIKHVASFCGGATPSRENLDYWNGDIPWVSPKDMKVERLTSSEESITEDGLKSCPTTLLSPGKVLMVVRSGILKHTIPVAINETAVALNQDMRSLDFARSECEANFFLRWVQGLNDQLLLAWAKQGATVESIEHEYLAHTTIPLPPLPEQTAIAEFLDRETGKIDELVAEQRRLMELLKEKRQAVISHAVTKGLNPHAPMKPSGIEWLGEVPEHWGVLPLKRIVTVPITDGPHETPQFVEEGIPFVSAEAVSSGQIDFTKVRACITPEDNARYSKKYSPKLHDIYMVKSGATTGVTAIVDGRTDFNIWSPLAAIRCNSDSVPFFVLNYMRSRHFLEAVTLFWSFGTQQNIGMSVIENLACTVPPLEEQQTISRYLSAELAKFDTLTAESQRAIDLLQERRTALISAAVTGQIDVRHQPRN